MTNEELNAIAARADAATPGPWRCEREITEEVGPWQIRTDVPELDDPMLPLALAGTCDDDTGDAVFIAAARTDVPALVEEVRKLRKEVEILRTFKDVRMLPDGSVVLRQDVAFDGPNPVIMVEFATEMGEETP